MVDLRSIAAPVQEILKNNFLRDLFYLLYSIQAPVKRLLIEILIYLNLVIISTLQEAI